MAYVVCAYLYCALIIGALAVFFGKLGNWPEIARRTWARLRGMSDRAAAVAIPVPPRPDQDPVLWPQLRQAGAVEAADRLAADLREGRMSDVDHARIMHAWQRMGAGQREAFVRDVLARGGGACAHGSGHGISFAAVPSTTLCCGRSVSAWVSIRRSIRGVTGVLRWRWTLLCWARPPC